MNDASEYRDLTEFSRKVELREVAIDVRPIDVGQAIEILAYTRSFIDVIRQQIEAAKKEDGTGDLFAKPETEEIRPEVLMQPEPAIDPAPQPKGPADIDIDVADLMFKHPQEFFEVVRLASDQDAPWLRSLALDEYLAVATAVLEVNTNFFFIQILPMFGRSMVRMAEALGQNLSVGSPAPVSQRAKS